MRWLPVVFVAACAAGSVRPGAGDAPEVRSDAERDYAIWLGGAQVGTAHEVEHWSPGSVTIARTEAMRFLRGDVAVAITTTIEIAADARLAPSRVTWTERAQATRRGEAVRDAAGWLVTDAAGVRRLPAAAIPAELMPLVIRRDRRFAGTVFLPARGFVAGAGRIEPIAPRRLVARLVLDDASRSATGASTAATGGSTAAPAPATAAVAEATIDLGDDAMPIRVVDGEGVIATRITAAEAAVPFGAVDLIAATSIPLAGSPDHASSRASTRSFATSSGAPRPPARRLLLDVDREVALPPVPGQAAHATADGVEIELSSQLAGRLPPGPRGADRTSDILWLVARVRGRIVPDLAAGPASVHSAAVATTGDCTTFALAYAALAADRQIPTRVVTGFRIDGDRLVRHRWAVSWTGAAWIAVDAAFGAVPAGGDLVGVAVHAADDVGLVAGEAALTRVHAAAWK